MTEETSDRAVNLILLADIPEAWQRELDLAALERLATTLLGAEGMVGSVELGLTLVEDDEIRHLNHQYRGVDSPTDVLSFSQQEEAGQEQFITSPDGVLRLGDVVVSYPRMLEQAEEYGHSPAREIGYLFAHGVLHLLGCDHETEEERALMRAKEESALASLGLQR